MGCCQIPFVCWQHFDMETEKKVDTYQCVHRILRISSIHCFGNLIWNITYLMQQVLQPDFGVMTWVV